MLPIFILSVAKRIYSKIPSIIGSRQWDEIRYEFDELLHKAEVSISASDKYLYSAQLLKLLSSYDSLLIQIDIELKIINIVYNEITKSNAIIEKVEQELIAAALAIFYAVSNWNFDNPSIFLKRIINEDLQLELRGVRLSSGGVGGAKSIKLKNFRFDTTEFLTLLGATSLIGHEIFVSPTPILICGGVLTIIGTLLNTLTVQIDEQDASVFWALITARNKGTNELIDDSKIYEITNQERKKYWLEPLEVRQLQYSLDKLRRLGAVEKIAKQSWIIIESFKIED